MKLDKIKFKGGSSFNKFKNDLGDSGFDFLNYSLASITRILPHIELEIITTSRYDDIPKGENIVARSRVTYHQERRRRIKLKISFPDSESGGYDIEVMAKRKTGSSVPLQDKDLTVLNDTEKKIIGICGLQIAQILSVSPQRNERGRETLKALKETWDEAVVSTYISQENNLQADISAILLWLRKLSEISYENKSICFGIIIDENSNRRSIGASFPHDYLHDNKKYRALSDGYHTAYVLSKEGSVTDFIEVPEVGALPGKYHPNWLKNICSICTDKNKKTGYILTKSGEIAVVINGNLEFTYRFGRWQFGTIPIF